MEIILVRLKGHFGGCSDMVESEDVGCHCSPEMIENLHL